MQQDSGVLRVVGGGVCRAEGRAGAGMLSKNRAKAVDHGLSLTPRYIFRALALALALYALTSLPQKQRL
jgi:hypothetical protein